jgi:hypothetical protein
MSLRVGADAEQEGLDSSLHGEAGYALGATAGHSEGATAPVDSERPIPYRPDTQHA